MKCTTCAKPSFKACKHCCEPYCSVTCQTSDWNNHRKVCQIGNKGFAAAEYQENGWDIRVPTYRYVEISPQEFQCDTTPSGRTKLGSGSYGTVYTAGPKLLGAIKISQHPIDIPIDPYEQDFIETSFIDLFQKLLLPNASPHVATMTNHDFCYDQEDNTGRMRWAISRAHYGDLRRYINEYPNDAFVLVRQALFQLTYTIACIQQRYPRFRHADLHPGNILVGLAPSEGHTVYHINGKTFALPNMGAMAILWDFGFSSIPGQLDNATFAQFPARTDPRYLSLDLYVLARGLVTIVLPEGAERTRLREDIEQIWGQTTMYNIDDIYSEPFPDTTLVSPANILAGKYRLFAPFVVQRVPATKTHEYNAASINQDVTAERIYRFNFPIQTIPVYYRFGARYDTRNATPGQLYYIQHAVKTPRLYNSEQDMEQGLANLDRYHRISSNGNNEEIADWAMAKTEAFIANNLMHTYSQLHILYRAYCIMRARATLGPAVNMFTARDFIDDVHYALMQLSWE